MLGSLIYFICAITIYQTYIYTRGLRSFHFAGNVSEYYLSRFALGDGASHRLCIFEFSKTLRRRCMKIQDFAGYRHDPQLM